MYELVTALIGALVVTSLLGGVAALIAGCLLRAIGVGTAGFVMLYFGFTYIYCTIESSPVLRALHTFALVIVAIIYILTVYRVMESQKKPLAQETQPAETTATN